MLHAKQIRGARAMLGWGQRKLAKATGLAPVTLRRLEAGEVGRPESYSAICRVIEENGLEFTDQQGIRSRPSGVQVIEGRDAPARMRAHILQVMSCSAT